MDTDIISRPTVLLFAKAPRPGTVKTRLAKDFGGARALALYRWLGRRQLQALPRGWPAVVYYAPADAEAEMRAWLGPQIALEPQCEGDLGSRLMDASERAFSGGATAVILVGTDCPSLQESRFVEASALLDRGCDAVFGPTPDGGYYLLAMRRLYPELFQDIPWSTNETLRESLRAAGRLGITTELLPHHDDIDTLADLRRAVEEGWIPAKIARP